MLAVAAPAFAATHKAGANHPGATEVNKKKKDKKDEKCDAAGKPCKDGEDCKPEHCKAGEPAPQQ